MSSPLRLTLTFVLLGAALGCVQAQFKTAGIKTHYTQQQQQQQQQYNTSTLHLQPVKYNYTDETSYNGHFVAADTYQGGAHFGHFVSQSQQQQQLQQQQRPVVLDATAEFINKTRAGMADGVCYKEVPTASLVDNPNVVPVGNGTTPDMSRIRYCCEGYERNAHVLRRCDPICADDCPNGICTAPNTCVCVPGHVRNFENKCISICPLGCGNGVCDERNQCQCKPGYKLEPKEQKFCVPECNPGCAHGQCVAPNKCACLDDYRLTAIGTCEPRCHNCENGQCTAPGYCSCNQGYMKVNSRCEPVCSLGCLNGRCVAPDTCACASGFEIDRTNSKCVAHCDLPCLNGICEGHNICTCNPGYVLDDLQRNVCKPHCPQGCPNGFCTSPNFCVCKPGFIKSGIKGRQTCISVSN